MYSDETGVFLGKLSSKTLQQIYDALTDELVDNRQTRIVDGLSNAAYRILLDDYDEIHEMGIAISVILANRMFKHPAVTIAKNALQTRGLNNLTQNSAERALYNGMISQDDYELYSDVWMTACPRYCVPYYQKFEAFSRLKKQFS